MPDAELEPLESVPALEDVRGGASEGDAAVLDRAVAVKLNGGLGTSMGMTRAKSLLEVKEGLSFLDVVAGQMRVLRERTGARLPLVLMNSASTRDDSLAALANHADAESDLPPDFLQSVAPKLRADDLMPIEWPANPQLEWAPPGHGDLYSALVSSGLLAAMLERGYEYAFVSNFDNLGAVLDVDILRWFAAEGVPFAMEVCRRTPADRKGGHLARRRGDGRLVLRESAQTPDEDQDSFQDVDRWRYFNCNSIWLNLRRLDDVLRAQDGFVSLPLIRNRKTVDPNDPESPAVFQLETAMGAAVEVFEGAQAILVPRERFAPVKTTNDLLLLESDAYVLTEEFHVVVSPEVQGEPAFVDLDPRHYKLLRDFQERFPDGPPSLVPCERFVVRGDVVFGRGVVCEGVVEIDHTGPRQLRITEGSRLGGVLP
jgi:UTP--glucose-1-phosphate uridylyltransferase